MYSLLQLCVCPDGMLIMRARPPPAQEFISVFQKFKLAINLLVSRFTSKAKVYVISNFANCCY